MSEFPNRVVAVLNKKLEPGRALNVLGHLSLAMGGINETEHLHLIDYYDKDENLYPNISKMPFVVLKEKPSKLVTLKNLAAENNIQHLVFTDAMIVGTWQEQIAHSKTKTADELTIYGVLLFGDAEKITELTRKFSLWN